MCIRGSISALANHGAGNSMLANEQIRRAVKLDPNNREYRQAQQQFQMAGQAYQLSLIHI